MTWKLLVGCPDHERVIAVIEDFLRARQPCLDCDACLTGRIVEAIAADAGLLRVEPVATLHGLSMRRLQRLFREYIGVGPKWVIRRYRMHEVMARIAAERGPDWATVAVDTGYADQSHFNRDFKSVVGRSPSEYARECAERSAIHPT